jgi:hypothetical protein
MKLVKSPGQYSKTSHKDIAIFLGGSIEMGKAEHWQKTMANELVDIENLLILDPRRDDWDSSWIQDPTPGTKFYEQVKWELDAQDDADLIVYYFCAGTQSPITLLELGLYADSQKPIIVCCPKEFWRYGNVKMVCDRYGIQVFDSFNELIDNVKTKIKILKK